MRCGMPGAMWTLLLAGLTVGLLVWTIRLCSGA
jgi:hypothetical protein